MKRTNKRCSPVIKGGKMTKVSKETENVERVWIDVIRIVLM